MLFSLSLGFTSTSASLLKSQRLAGFLSWVTGMNKSDRPELLNRRCLNNGPSAVGCDGLFWAPRKAVFLQSYGPWDAITWSSGSYPTWSVYRDVIQHPETSQLPEKSNFLKPPTSWNLYALKPPTSRNSGSCCQQKQHWDHSWRPKIKKIPVMSLSLFTWLKNPTIRVIFKKYNSPRF